MGEDLYYLVDYYTYDYWGNPTHWTGVFQMPLFLKDPDDPWVLSGDYPPPLAQIQCDIAELAVYELVGFVYTCRGVTGYNLYKVEWVDLDFDTGVRIVTYKKAIAWTTTATTVTYNDDGTHWRLYQADGGNHPHRPIYGVKENERWALYRITSVPA